MRRVVITGMGMVAPLGKNVQENWNNIINSKSGIKNITKFPIAENNKSDICTIAGEVYENENDGFNPSLFIDKKELRRMDKFTVYGVAAAEEAVRDAGLTFLSEEEKENIGVLVSSGIGGLESIQNISFALKEKGAKKISPFFLPSSLINLVAGHIAIKYGFMGINFSLVSACASGTHSIGEGAEIIKRNDADIILVGGAEHAVCEVGIHGFCAMHALSTKFNNTPEKASRPWDKNRDGFIMGEGAGVLVLEEYEHAKKRGVKIYAELTGYGTSCDAFHITAPHEHGKGAKKSIVNALKKANITTDDIGYINAHGTSTPIGDVLEFNAVKDIFKNSLNILLMSSTKSAIGHLLGAAGAVEAIFSILSLNSSIIPPTLNLEELDENCQGIDLVPLKAKEKKINYALSNSFGFGGTNASLIFKKI